MNNHKKLYFFIIAVFVGYLGTLQIKANFTYQGIITIPKLLEIQMDADNLINENKKLRDSTNELNLKLEEYIQSIEETGSIYGKMEKELVQIRDLAGYEKVEGPGIIMSLNDSLNDIGDVYNTNWLFIHDLDIIEVVNELKAAGAEAISINGERVVSSTNIRCGGPTINIDTKRHAVPFVIKAIGDPKRLEATATSPDSYIDLMMYSGIRVDIQTVESLIIKGYDLGYKTNFQRIVKGGEGK